jgi:hypothetical protein
LSIRLRVSCDPCGEQASLLTSNVIGHDGVQFKKSFDCDNKPTNLENLICRMILQFDVLFVTIDKLVEEAQLPGQPHEK